MSAKTKAETNKTRKLPCPKGTRYNKITKRCVPNTLAAADVEPLVAEPVMPNASEKKKRKVNCPKGTRRNAKTGECEPIKDNKSVAVPATLAPVLSETVPVLSETVPVLSETAPVLSKTAPVPATLVPVLSETAPVPSVAQSSEKIQNANKNKQELLEREDLKKNANEYDFLYPSLNDPQFNVKIAERKEFNDSVYDGDIYPDIAKQAELLCNSEFELAPHQHFVRNFLSFQTPYNSLLLYHGLGSGKTCSAISVAEEMRDYIMQMGLSSQIMIVASPNVQSNFKTQLFDERKLKLVDGLWNIRTCTGNKFLKEINPMNMKGLTRENVIKQINRLIDTYYYFFGYIEFANYINKKSAIDDPTMTDEKKIAAIRKNKLRKIFNNRLIIIDEVHNIRMTEDNKDKRVADELTKLIKHVNTLRLLLLSATPMFNSYKEIIWLINLMNMNDRRATLESKEVFNADGTFRVSASGEEIGRELLERKATGYISFVRGENPYTFPYRIWTKEYAPAQTFPAKTYPSRQLNGTTPLVQPIEHLSLYIVENGTYQQRGYNYIIQRLRAGQIGNYKQMPSMENIETFGYTMLQQPIEALNIIYPDERLKEGATFNSLELVGAEGLKRIMTYTEDPSTHARGNFDYPPQTLTNYGRLFAPNEIGKYSGKYKTICDRILASKGVILIYSQYIDAGLVPLVLALEECGFMRAGNGRSLFKNKPPPLTGAVKPIYNKYVMITGDKGFSPNPAEDIKMATDDDNVNGEKVKVVLISQTGAEGLDLKFIRQVHILEPWYNMSRIEQIIGRAVRTCSHKALPFLQRNVEIYLYGSLSVNTSEGTGTNAAEEETADLYLYRLAEIKAIQIGKVSRVLKEISIDCILNQAQLNFSEEHLAANKVLPMTLELGSGIILPNYKIGDKPFSAICDYMESCSYTCRPNKDLKELVGDAKLDTYNEDFIMMNNDKLIYKIKQLMKERFFYRKKDLVVLLNVLKPYPLVQINAALHQLVEDKNEYVTDKYGRLGNLINIADLYLFQPLELKNTRVSIRERSIPLEVKHDKLAIKIPKELKLNEAIINIKDVRGQAQQVQAQQVQAQQVQAQQVQAQQQQQIPTEQEIPTEQAQEQIPTEQAEIESELPAAENENLKSVYSLIEEKFSMATSLQKITKGEKNWYMFCHIGTELLKQNGLSEASLQQLIAEHICDEFSFYEFMLLLNEVSKPINTAAPPNLRVPLKHINAYINRQILTGKNGLKGILWKNNGKLTTVVKQAAEPWHIGESEDIKDLSEVVLKKKTDLLTHLNSIMGFMNNFKQENYVVFKTKNINNPRDLGARCDQNSNKSKAIDILNAIIEENMYSTKLDIPQKGICILQELYLRSFEKTQKNKKHWFLSPPEAELTNIEKHTTVIKPGKKK